MRTFSSVSWLRPVVSAVMFSMTLMACGDSSGPSVKTVAAPPNGTPATSSSVPPPAAVKRVGLVMKTLTNPFFIEMEKGARRAEKELGIELLVKTAAQETSIEQQIQLVEDLIAAKVDAIVLAPGDSQSVVPSLKKAAAASIKLVNLDNRINPADLAAAGVPPVPFISVDSEKGAYAAAKMLADLAKGPTKVAIIEGIRSADNARQRMEGAKRAFAENKNIKLVASESANWKIDESYSVTKKLFAKYPDLQMIFAANDMMAMGAAKYLQEAGKTQVKVAGFDAVSEAINQIKAGQLTVSVDQQAAEQGYQGVVMAMKLIKGEPVPELILVDTRLVTAESLK